MTARLIGYTRCSTDQQDLTAQRDGLTALGVAPARVYVDHGLTGTNRERRDYGVDKRPRRAQNFVPAGIADRSRIGLGPGATVRDLTFLTWICYS